MIRTLLKEIEAEFSSFNAHRILAGIIRYHRIQASPGFRKAAEYAAEVLKKAGFTPEIISFPSDGKTHYFSHLSPEEWEVAQAELWLINPKMEKLADFFDDKLSLIQRSVPCRVEAPIVALQDGEEREEYQNIDVKDKIVLTKGNLRRVYELACEEYGAIGILYDGIREIPNFRSRLTNPEALSYTSFFWTPKDKRCFGFVISPKKGEELRELIRDERKKGKTCKLKAVVDASFKKGEIEVVSAFIPGESREEVWIVAHLCHPQPSANDNASGAAVLLESARTIQSLIKSRRLSKPKRGLRFLLVPEMLGTCAYLSSRDISNVIAGCNLDMVGQNQSKCGSSFLIERTPHASASFTDFLLQRIREELLCEVSPFSGSACYPLFRHAVTPFSGGSDHAILSDPTVGIPTPMLIQWPDYFYHTNQDTLDKVDPRMLKLIGMLASTYAYFIANADKRMLDWFLNELIAGLKIEVISFFRSKLKNSKEIEQRELKMLRDVILRKVDSMKCLGVGKLDIAKSELRRFMGSELKAAHRLGLVQQLGKKTMSRWEREASELVPSRLYKGPVNLRSHRHLLTNREKDKLHRLRKKYSREFSQIPVLAQFWMNGKRSLLEIAELVEFEISSKDIVRFLVPYFKILARIGLIGLKVRKR